MWLFLTFIFYKNQFFICNTFHTNQKTTIRFYIIIKSLNISVKRHMMIWLYVLKWCWSSQAWGATEWPIPGFTPSIPSSSHCQHPSTHFSSTFRRSSHLHTRSRLQASQLQLWWALVSSAASLYAVSTPPELIEELAVASRAANMDPGFLCRTSGLSNSTTLEMERGSGGGGRTQLSSVLKNSKASYCPGLSTHPPTSPGLQLSPSHCSWPGCGHNWGQWWCGVRWPALCSPGRLHVLCAG